MNENKWVWNQDLIQFFFVHCNEVQRLTQKITRDTKYKEQYKILDSVYRE